MKVLHIIPSLKKGGAERLVLDICKELSIRKGIEVQLLVFRNENEYCFLTDNFTVTTIPAYIIPSVLRKWKTNVQALSDFIKSFQPDIIHSHLFEAEMVSRFELQKACYISHLHDNMPQLRNFSVHSLFDKRKLTNLYEKRFLIKKYRVCRNNFLAISNDTKNYFLDVLPSDLHRIHMLNNAIQYQRFFNPNPKLITSKKIKLVTAGSLVDKKNQIFLVDIAKELIVRGIDFTIDVLGDGPNREKIQQKISNENLERYISLLGNVNQIEKYYRQSDIYIHPAYYEPFGLVLLEAMAAGLPVVSLDGKGNRDIMQNGKNGFMICEQRATLFADVISDLINNKNLYANISASAKEFARTYDIVTYIDKLTEYYISVRNFAKAE